MTCVHIPTSVQSVLNGFPRPVSICVRILFPRTSRFLQTNNPTALSPCLIVPTRSPALASTHMADFTYATTKVYPSIRSCTSISLPIFGLLVPGLYCSFCEACSAFFKHNNIPTSPFVQMHSSSSNISRSSSRRGCAPTVFPLCPFCNVDLSSPFPVLLAFCRFLLVRFRHHHFVLCSTHCACAQV
jgi:hypothetical protein